MTKTPRITRLSVVRNLIAEGKTNAEIWAVIQPQFRLRDDQRHYPAWYRRHLKRRERKIKDAEKVYEDLARDPRESINHTLVCTHVKRTRGYSTK